MPHVKRKKSEPMCVTANLIFIIHLLQKTIPLLLAAAFVVVPGFPQVAPEFDAIVPEAKETSLSNPHEPALA